MSGSDNSPQPLPVSPAPAPAPSPGREARPGSLVVRPLEGGLVLRQATSEQFLPSVQPWVRAAGFLLLGSFVAAVGLMAAWPYRVVVRGSGMVRPSGETSVIHAPFAARVRQVMVQPNQKVWRGQVLALLDPADLQGRDQQLRQSRRALLLQSRALIKQGAAAQKSASLEVQKSESALRFAEAEYLRFQQLSGTGSITATQLQEKEESYHIAKANLAKAQEAVAEQRSRSISEQAQLERELVTNRADGGQLNRDLAKTSVRSPLPGVLFSLSLRNPGQMIAAGDELARIAPSQVGLLVKVLVPSQDITTVDVGQRADLRIAGCPYPDYGTLRATVASIAPEASQVAPGERAGGRAGVPAPAAASMSGLYEVTLKPQGITLGSGSRLCEVRIGMDLSADITTKTETVLGFLLRKARLTAGV